MKVLLWLPALTLVSLYIAFPTVLAESNEVKEEITDRVPVRGVVKVSGCSRSSDNLTVLWLLELRRMTIESPPGGEEIHLRGSSEIVSRLSCLLWHIADHGSHFSDGVVFEQIPHHNPDLVLFNAADQEIEVSS